MIKLKVMLKSVNNVVLRPSCQQDVRLTKMHLFLIESTSTEGPATSSSSPAPNEISLLDVLRSIVAPTKVNFCLNCLGDVHSHLLNLHRCLYHSRRLKIK